MGTVWNLLLLPPQDRVDPRGPSLFPRNPTLQCSGSNTRPRGLFGTNGTVQLRSHPLLEGHVARWKEVPLPRRRPRHPVLQIAGRYSPVNRQEKGGIKWKLKM